LPKLELKFNFSSINLITQSSLQVCHGNLFISTRDLGLYQFLPRISNMFYGNHLSILTLGTILDIDGDGRADYLCLDKDGRVTGALSFGEGKPIITSAQFLPYQYRSVGQVKFAEGADRSSLHFADINGDGRDDLLWVNKWDGSVKAWTNEGQIPTGGSSFFWGNNGGLVSYGKIARGENINYGNIYGQGRADLIVVHPDTAVADTYFNLCPGGAGRMPILPPLPGCTVC
jgi:hypothetical protein